MIRRRDARRISQMTTTALCRQTLIDTLIMTSAAIGDPMGSPQRESRYIMVESCLVPEILCMTFLTGK